MCLEIQNLERLVWVLCWAKNIPDGVEGMQWTAFLVLMWNHHKIGGFFGFVEPNALRMLGKHSTPLL